MNWEDRWRAWVMRRSEVTRLLLVFLIIATAPLTALFYILATLP